MAFSLLTPKKRIINIIINDHSIRYLELKQAQPLTVLKWGERILPPGLIQEGKIADYESLVNILEECIDEWKISRRSIRFIVPDQMVIIRKVSVPSDIEDDEIKGYLYLELGSTIHLPYEEPVFDIHLMGDNGKTKDVLLFAAPEQQVSEYVHLFNQVKLQPLAADISPLALYRVYDQLDQADHEEALFTIQFDLSSVNFCIFEGTVPLVMRQFSLPYDWETWEIKPGSLGKQEYKYKGNKEELDITFDEIYREISKLLDFYKYALKEKKKEITKFLVQGDHPMLKDIADEVAERFEIPVLTLYNEANSKGKTGGVPANLLLTLGLALKGVT
ncbi:pilus assembly protein PilM [Bacillus sp. BRMEA1]|uniref:type IV pilus biogenesis protein PilM n=1 Tax=Neobacillus endophyticus TaxID=2738405 RepID=UPI001565FBC6|nr:pilus assembly protein PilM [Neobacillus endophyticus]NRD75999.1 pilus assembly protein PilM [Neobacillus endophyticus]